MRSEGTSFGAGKPLGEDNDSKGLGAGPERSQMLVPVPVTSLQELSGQVGLLGQKPQWFRRGMDY